jgi:hypothetical protein
MDKPTDYEVVAAMERWGGHFVKCLASAYKYADSENQKKIRETWPEYWEKYTKFARSNKELAEYVPSQAKKQS